MEKKTVKKVAELAKINLSEKELEILRKDFDSILKVFDLLKKAESGEKPAFQPIESRDVLRPDKPGKSLSQEEALHNAKNKEKGYFKGPKVV